MPIFFKRVTSVEPVARYVAQQLVTALSENHKVLWLTPGGSAIAVASVVSEQVKSIDLSGLTVTLTDERYGPVGHPDSNWLQLEETGFSLPGATLLPVLRGKDREATVAEWDATLRDQLKRNDYRFGLFGFGPDGHTAGILPNSPAVTSDQFANGYDAGNFQRITMTPLAIAKLDEAVVYAMGEAKRPVLEQLSQTVDVPSQPAQALKQVPSLTIYNDLIGEDS